MAMGGQGYSLDHVLEESEGSFPRDNPTGGGYYMFTRRAKEKAQLRVLKFWEGFSSTSSAPWRPSALPATARAGLWVVGSCQLFLPQVILDRVLRWHHPDHPRHHSPALKVCPSLHSHHLQVKAPGLSSFETILHGLTAKPRSGRPFPVRNHDKDRWWLGFS